MGSPASGSDDFTAVTEMLQSMSTWGQGQGSADISENISAARRTFAMMLCARFFILKQLVQHFPVLGHENDDLFVKVLWDLRRADTDVMLDIVCSSLHNIMSHYRENRSVSDGN